MKRNANGWIACVMTVVLLFLTGTGCHTAFAAQNRGNIITELRNTAPVDGVAYSSAEAYEGDWSVHVNYAGNWSLYPIAAKCAEFGMTTGARYDISFYFKGSAESIYVTAKSMSIWGNAIYAPGGEYPDVGQTITTLDNGWSKFEVKNYALTNADNALLYTTIGGNSGDKVNDFYLDNLSVTDLATGTELIQNSSFEPEAVIDPPPEREDHVIREFYNTAEIAGVTYSADEAQAGDWSVHVKDPEENKGISAKWSDFGLQDNKTYRISFWLKGNVKHLYLNVGKARIQFDAATPTKPKKLNSTDTASENGQWAVSTLADTPDANGWYEFVWPEAHTQNSMESGDYTAALSLFSIDPKTDPNEDNADFYIDNLSIKEVVDGVPGAELVQNGGFEAGAVIDPPTPPDPPVPGEQPVRKDAPFVRELLHEEAVEGIAYSAAEANDGKWSVHISQAKDLTPSPEMFGIQAGKTYSARFDIKGSIGSVYLSFTGSTRVLVTDTEIRSGSVEDIKKIPLENGWYRIEINNATAAAAGWTPPFLLAEGDPDFYLDNLSVTELDETGNPVRELIENGSFEPPAMEFGAYSIVTGADGEKTVSIDVINHSAGEDAPVQLILATYNGTFMTACAKDLAPTAVAENDRWVTLTQSIKVKNGEKAFAYLWDSTDGMTSLLPSQPIVE